MKKLSLILVLLTSFSVNSQEFEKQIKFTAIVSENYFKRTDSFSLPTLSIGDKKSKLSIYQMVNLKTDSSVVVKKLPKVEILNYYSIVENVIITAPDWEFANIDAFGFKLCYQIR
jgi:hypothetical protein